MFMVSLEDKLIRELHYLYAPVFLPADHDFTVLSHLHSGHYVFELEYSLNWLKGFFLIL